MREKVKENAGYVVREWYKKSNCTSRSTRLYICTSDQFYQEKLFSSQNNCLLLAIVLRTVESKAIVRAEIYKRIIIIMVSEAIVQGAVVQKQLFQK